MPAFAVEGQTYGGLRSSAALAQYRRVRLSSGKLAYAGAADTDCLGTLCKETFAADEPVSYRVASGDGIHVMVASEAVALTDTLYAAANGKVATSGTVLVGKPLSTASADGDYIAVQPSAAAVLGNIARSALTQDALKVYPVPLASAKTWDAMQTNIPGTAANDDLGLVTGTLGTDFPSLQTGDLKAAGATTRYAIFEIDVPAEYDAGETITLRLNAGMKTTVADTAATVDAVVYREAAPTVDVCATAAQSINSLTAADKDFTVTPTGVTAGEKLLVRVALSVTDAATGTAVIGVLNSVELLFDVKG